MPVQLYIGLPNAESRENIFKSILTKESPVDWKVLAERTEGFSGSDTREVCRRAALDCLNNDRPEIQTTDLLNAIHQVNYIK